MLFITLPSELRNMTNCSSESFKQALDTFLKTIPDKPQTHGYTYMRRADSNSLIHMTPLTTARHPSISKSLTTCHKLEAATHGHLGTEPGNHRHVSTSKQERVGSRLLAMTAVCQWILSSGSGCISSNPTSHHGTSMITLLPTSSCSGFYSHAPEVPRVLHERVMGRYILFRGTFLLIYMSYRRAVVSHCPISILDICAKRMLWHKHGPVGVFLAYLNIAGIGSSRYDIDIMAI